MDKCKLNQMTHVYILTYIGGSFRYRQVGADAPGSSVVVPFTAAAVGPCGVVFTFTA